MQPIILADKNHAGPIFKVGPAFAFQQRCIAVQG
jgi:hypothetical protein